MKKIILSAVVLGAAVLPFYFALAVQFDNPLKVGTFEQLLDAVINFIFWVGIVLAPLMLIVGGFMYITSAGSPTGVTRAKNTIIWTLVGLTFLIAAKGLVNVIKSVLGI